MLENFKLLIILQKEFASSFFLHLEMHPHKKHNVMAFQSKKKPAKLVQLITECSWLPRNQIIFNFAFLLERWLWSRPKIVGPLPNYDTCWIIGPQPATQWSIMELAPTQPKHPLWDDTLTLGDKGRVCNRYHVIWIIISDLGIQYNYPVTIAYPWQYNLSSDTGKVDFYPQGYFSISKLDTICHDSKLIML